MRNISAIHNYCDRWCKRCPFTARCAVFEAESRLPKEAKDMKNQAFWDNISTNLKKGLDLLSRAAKRFGGDINEVSEQELEEIQRQREEKERILKEHSLHRLTNRYADLVRKLLDDNSFWKAAATDLIASLKTGVMAEQQVLRDEERMKEYREVIGWYCFFIHAKFTRALSGQLNDLNLTELYEAEDGNYNPNQSDANGSAKIAIIAVEKSMAAWTGLFELIPDEDKIFPVLSLLEKILGLARREFPYTDQFVRPGFDEIRR